MNRRELLELAVVRGAMTMSASAAAAEPRAAVTAANTPFVDASASASATTRIQMLVYPGMTLQDLVGPLQVWAGWPGVGLQFVWKSTGPLPTDAGLSVVATTVLADAWESPDLIFVPGGLMPTFQLLDDAEVIGFLKQRGAKAKWVTSVCSGALVLGAAGLLKGYRAATHWFVRDALPMFGAIPSKERWVIDRNRATGGGVTAGIDFGLAVMAHVVGEDIARAAQLRLEYSPRPPLRSGTPEEATEATLAAVKSGWSGRSAAQFIQQKLQAASRRVQG